MHFSNSQPLLTILCASDSSIIAHKPLDSSLHHRAMSSTLGVQWRLLHEKTLSRVARNVDREPIW